jgi:hypothetical protein
MLLNLTPESLTTSTTYTKSSDTSNFPILSQVKKEVNQLDFISKIKANTGVTSSSGTSNNTSSVSVGTSTTATNAAPATKQN